MSQRAPTTLIRDMLDSAARIMRLVEGTVKDDFLALNDAVIQDAVSYRLVVIGEAAATLLAKYPDFCQAHPDVPWKSVRAMRNFIVHDYMSVDPERLWETAKVSIPELVASLQVLA